MRSKYDPIILSLLIVCIGRQLSRSLHIAVSVVVLSSSTLDKAPTVYHLLSVAAARIVVDLCCCSCCFFDIWHRATSNKHRGTTDRRRQDNKGKDAPIVRHYGYTQLQWRRPMYRYAFDLVSIYQVSPFWRWPWHEFFWLQ